MDQLYVHVHACSNFDPHIRGHTCRGLGQYSNVYSEEVYGNSFSVRTSIIRDSSDSYPRFYCLMLAGEKRCKRQVIKTIAVHLKKWPAVAVPGIMVPRDVRGLSLCRWPQSQVDETRENMFSGCSWNRPTASDLIPPPQRSASTTQESAWRSLSRL